jgi:putative tributyrin esterase
MQDKTFHSDALSSDVTYRIVEPVTFQPGMPVKVVYLLHGKGEDFRIWSIATPIAQLATKGYVLVMPDGRASYFLNSATRPGDRYEDFITHDLIADAERGLPSQVKPQNRAIIGNSMGGFAAIVLSFKHPGLYGFAGALSPPVEVPSRPFTVRRLSQSLSYRAIFGPVGSANRRGNDPFVLARSVDPNVTPFLYLSVGDHEGLREPVIQFEGILQARHIPNEFHLEQGSHNWQQWNHELPLLLDELETKHESTTQP